MNPKTINLNCDISSGEIIMKDAEGKEPVIRRSDFLKFVLAVKDGGNDYGISDVQKVHIFAKAMQRGVAPTKDAPSLFYKIFDKAENGEYEIPSELTTGEAGYYMLSVVLVKDTSLMTAFTGVFELKENGSGIIDLETVTPEYSGMFAQMLQAAMEAANAAAESKADAETALENMETLETTIAGYKTAAEEAAGNAADSEAFVVQNAQEAEDFRNEAEGFASAAQNSQAAAELAAETTVNSSDLAALCRRAANVGGFDFNTGKLAFDKPSIITASPFSLCVTYDVDSWEGLGGNPTGGLAFFNNHCAVWTDPVQKGGFHLCYEEAGRLFFACGNLDATPATREFKATINKLLPVGRHTLVLCVLGGLASSGAASIRCYLDGLYFGDMSPSYNTLSDDDISSTLPLQINTTANYATSTVAPCPIDVKLSRLKIFNFDMSVSGAPYTVADYAAGIDPSPALLIPALAPFDSDMGADVDGGWTFGSAPINGTIRGDWKIGDQITYVKNRDLSLDSDKPADVEFAVDVASDKPLGYSSSVSFLVLKDQFMKEYVGRKIRLRYGFWIRPLTTGVVLRIGQRFSEYVKLMLDDLTLNAWSYLSGEADISVSEVDITYPLCISISKGGIGDQPAAAIANFKFEVVGAKLSLSDAADASQIRDESGNGSHALISGAVLPSKQNNPAHCAQKISWAGTSTLQNVCGDSAIPANSKVTAYAKASGAVTASFKAGANAAESKALTANTLTEIGSWLCGASGAFSVQPSAAYTGSIEAYLTIERF